MIENLETLLALSKSGTMLEASTELRISQSAVSKRIATLEKYYERKLIQKKGRRVELTRHGKQLVDKISPILSELRDLFVEDTDSVSGELNIGVSEAILSSWGPQVFYEIRQQMLLVRNAFLRAPWFRLFSFWYFDYRTSNDRGKSALLNDHLDA